MAQYAILIYEDEAGYAAGGQELYGKVMEEHTKFAAAAGAAITGGQALQPTTTATSIRSDGNGGSQRRVPGTAQAAIRRPPDRRAGTAKSFESRPRDLNIDVPEFLPR